MTAITMPPQPPPLSLRYVYKDVEVLRVIDGDTLSLRFPLPFHITVSQTVRLAGINTPEVVGTDRAAGLAAADFLRVLLSGSPPLIVQTLKTEKYGRLLAHLWVEQGVGWTHVNAELIRAGHAQPYDGGPR